MIELQPFERKDFDRLIRWIDTPELLMIWGGPAMKFPLDFEQLENYLESSRGEQPVRHIYRVVETRTGQVVGHIELNNIDHQNRSGTLSRVMVGEPSMRGRGIGEQMVRLLLEIAFDQEHLHRIDLVVFDFNHHAMACYEKVGFIKEGLLRHHRKMGDQYWSNVVMSILENEWQTKKKAD